MRKGLEKLLLFLLRKVSGHSIGVSVQSPDRLADRTVVTLDIDGPGVMMKLYRPDQRA